MDPAWVVYGWWLGARPVRRLVIATASGAPQAAWLGIARPDLAAAYPSVSYANRAGFLALASDPQARAKVSVPPAEWWAEDETGAWWNGAIDLAVHSPVAFTCDAPAEPPPAIRACQHDPFDPESRLRLALAASRGITLRLDITNKCNLRCVMCHYQRDDVFRRPAQHVSPAQFEQWFAEVSPLVGEVMLSCADEPLVSRFFPDIIHLIRRLRPDVEIKFCTNGMLMTAPIRRLLVEAQVDLIVVSIDGCTRAMFESIRTGARFDRVISHTLALADLRDRSGSTRPEIVTNFVMMQRNLHEAPPYVTLARRLGASTADFRHVVASYEGFDLQAEQLRHAPGRYNFYRERLLELGSSEGVKLYLPPPFEDAPPWSPGQDEPSATLDDFEAVVASFAPDSPVENLPPRTASNGPAGWLHLPDLFEDTFCPRPFSEIMIREQQEILPCPWHARPLGQLQETPRLLDAFFGEEFRFLRRQMLRPDGDEHCRHCPLKAHELPSERFS